MRYWSIRDEDVIELVRRKYNVVISPDQIAKARGLEFRISWKKAIEVARAVKFLTIKQAEEYMEKVKDLEAPVPIKEFTKKQAHHNVPWDGWPTAKWPAKVADAFLQVLRNLENNASYRGLNVDNTVIVHASASRGMRIRNYMPRALGRATPWFQDTVNIELAAVELPTELVPKKFSWARVLKSI
ncbi:50S ribosomal protein L22 [Caldivirga sp.]|uniref:50S ribosomal protein L22 n=1 Tax=Caldivirga sp. TaxID=2080243 RepID=UPI0025BCBECF|nr:50S ribosomal protein L22 [Caldivirga sp.]